MNITTIGFVAGFLTSVAAVPQLIKSFRSHHMSDISIWQPLLLSIGVALWMLYGFLLNNMPLILANIVPLVCNIVLTVMKISYRDDDK